MYNMKEMTWKEFENKKDQVLILPIGSTEQHGPHLPLSVDTVIAEGFAKRLAEELDGVCAPALSYGYKSKPFSGGGPLFPGTIDLNGQTLQNLVQDVIDEFVRDGFRRILLFNAHFENEPFVVEAMDLCSARHGDRVRLLLMNWWDPMSPNMIGRIFDQVPFPGWALEHAAITETSLMMYVAPELVRQDLIADVGKTDPGFCYRYPIDKDSIPSNGVLATARSSSAQKGQWIVEDVVSNISDFIRREFC